MTPKQLAAITKHGESLKLIFGLPANTDPVKLCKQLRRLENKGEKAAVDYCNGAISYGRFEAIENEIMGSLVVLLGGLAGSICFVNGDPRGYSLKIKDEEAKGLDIHKDWGGYGILAPEIDKDGRM